MKYIIVNIHFLWDKCIDFIFISQTNQYFQILVYFL